MEKCKLAEQRGQTHDEKNLLSLTLLLSISPHVTASGDALGGINLLEGY